MGKRLLVDEIETRGRIQTTAHLSFLSLEVLALPWAETRSEHQRLTGLGSTPGLPLSLSSLPLGASSPVALDLVFKLCSLVLWDPEIPPEKGEAQITRLTLLANTQL